MAPQAPITRAIAKKKAGKQMTTEEQAAYDAHVKASSARSARIYFDSPIQLAEYQATAANEGYSSFTGWVRDKLDLATTGQLYDPELIQDMQQTIRKLEERIEQERDLTEEYRDRCRILQEKVEEYADHFFRLAGDKIEANQP